MSFLTDANMTDRYVRPIPTCNHTSRTEYKIHLDETVCVCGARRREFGPDRQWKRRAADVDHRTPDDGNIDHIVELRLKA